MVTKLVTRLATTSLAISAHSKRLKHLHRCSFPGFVPQTLHPLMDICTTARPCRAASHGHMRNSTAAGHRGTAHAGGRTGLPGKLFSGSLVCSTIVSTWSAVYRSV